MTWATQPAASFFREEALEALSDDDLLCDDCLDQLREEEIDRRLGVSDDQKRHGVGGCEAGEACGHEETSRRGSGHPGPPCPRRAMPVVRRAGHAAQTSPAYSPGGCCREYGHRRATGGSRRRHLGPDRERGVG